MGTLCRRPDNIMKKINLLYLIRELLSLLLITFMTFVGMVILSIIIIISELIRIIKEGFERGLRRNIT
jgi:hypothetical protein